MPLNESEEQKNEKTEERRRYVRKKTLADIIIKYHSREFDAVAYDISLGGVHFVATQVIPVGNFCTISLNKKNCNVSAYGAIRWMKPSDNKKGIIYYGLEFDNPLTVNEMNQFL